MNVHLGVPQVLMILAYISVLVIGARDHGKMKKQDFWSSSLGVAIGVAILIWGGFFS